MASSPVTFDTLPNEVIQRIASVASCETVLALSKVNWHFHLACYDSEVFRAVIKNGSGHGVTQPWDCDLISDFNTSTPTLAKLALADSRARTWLASAVTEDKIWKGGKDLTSLQQWNDSESFESDLMNAPTPTAPDPVLQWAQPLVVLKHPFFMDGDHVQHIVNRLGCVRPLDYEDSLKIDFCITATILYHCSAALNHGSAIGPELREYLRRVLFGSSKLRLPANLICSLVFNAHMLLKDAPLPVPSMMPFLALFKEPLPFVKNDLCDRGISHLKIMTSTEFLQSGEWMGYYNYTMNLNRTIWDPAMKDIVFTATPNAGQPTALRATGIDHVGSFSLDGSINILGEVNMRKTYHNAGPRWEWDALMTPFGIVGTWGAGTSPRGFFWLWKREWTTL